MKKLSTLFLFISVCILSYGQTTTLIPAGQYYVKNFTSSDEIVKAPRNTKIESKYAVPFADTIFYVPTTASDDTISTLISERPIGKKALIVIQRGSSIGRAELTEDSILVTSYGTGVIPVIDTLIKDTITYPNVVTKNIDIENAIYIERFYVSNSGSNDSTGLTPTTAWATISKVNSSSFIPGDQILFEKGDTWREQLTVPSSGDADDNIVFAAYGTGDKPVINAADTLTGWTASLVTTSEWSNNLSTSVANSAYYNFRQVIPKDSIGATATQIRIKIVSGTHDTDIDGASIGLRSGTTSTFLATPTRIKFNGIDSVLVPNGQSVWSDWVTFNVETGKDYLVQIHTNQRLSGTNDGFTYNTVGYNYRSTSPGDSTLSLTDVGMSGFSNTTRIIGGFETRTGTENLWYANAPVIPSLSGIPANYVCVLDGTFQTSTTSIAAVDAVGEYFVDTAPSPDVIYVYSATDPDSRVAEVSNQFAGILVNKKSYITIKDLEVKYAGHSGIYCYGQDNATPYGNSLITNCYSHHNRNVGIMLNRAYGNTTVSYCEASYNGNNFYSAYSSGVANSGSNNNTFSHCTSSNSIAYAAGTGYYSDGHAFGIYQSDSCLIEYCTSNNDDSGIVSDPAGTDNAFIARYNVINATNKLLLIAGGNSSGTKKHEIYYNVFANSKSPSSGVISLVNSNVNSGIHFYNNTIYHLNGYTTRVFSMTAGTGVNLKNNILYSTGTGGLTFYESSALVQSSDNNWFDNPSNFGHIKIGATTYYLDHPTSGNITNWRAFSNQDLNSGITNPLFTNPGTDFTLQTGSPCINAGVEIPGLPNTDILGNPIVGNRDIGAYEKQ